MAARRAHFRHSPRSRRCSASAKGAVHLKGLGSKLLTAGCGVATTTFFCQNEAVSVLAGYAKNRLPRFGKGSKPLMSEFLSTGLGPKLARKLVGHSHRYSHSFRPGLARRL